jgi:hypothetical protein
MNRVEIEEVENGYSVVVYKRNEDEESDLGYTEPTKYVAKDKAEAMKIFEENF